MLTVFSGSQTSQRRPGGGGDETEWSKEKNKSVSISQQRLAAEGVRLGCGAAGPSYRPVPELLTSLRSHGLGM